MRVPKIIVPGHISGCGESRARAHLSSRGGSRLRPKHSRLDDMDKDNRDDFTFAKLSDLKLPVTLRMLVIFVEFVAQWRTHDQPTVRNLKEPEYLERSPNF